MKQKILAMYQKYQQIISYVFFGGFTTVVNYIVYYPLYNLCHFSGTLSNILAWAVSVIFAFFTNKLCVFKSKEWSGKAVSEFIKFVGSRLGTGILETLIIHITVDILLWNGNLWKVVVSVFVVILNYITSKFFAFKKK